MSSEVIDLKSLLSSLEEYDIHRSINNSRERGDSSVSEELSPLDPEVQKQSLSFFHKFLKSEIPNFERTDRPLKISFDDTRDDREDSNWIVFQNSLYPEPYTCKNIIDKYSSKDHDEYGKMIEEESPSRFSNHRVFEKIVPLLDVPKLLYGDYKDISNESLKEAFLGTDKLDISIKEDEKKFEMRRALSSCFNTSYTETLSTIILHKLAKKLKCPHFPELISTEPKIVSNFYFYFDDQYDQFEYLTRFQDGIEKDMWAVYHFERESDSENDSDDDETLSQNSEDDSKSEMVHFNEDQIGGKNSKSNDFENLNGKNNSSRGSSKSNQSKGSDVTHVIKSCSLKKRTLDDMESGLKSIRLENEELDPNYFLNIKRSAKENKKRNDKDNDESQFTTDSLKSLDEENTLDSNSKGHENKETHLIIKDMPCQIIRLKRITHEFSDLFDEDFDELFHRTEILHHASIACNYHEENDLNVTRSSVSAIRELLSEDDLQEEVKTAQSNFDKFSKKMSERWISILYQLCVALAVAQESFGFVHNDLHYRNIMLESTAYETITYTVNGNQTTIKTYGVLVKIIDFGRATFIQDGVYFLGSAFETSNEAGTQYSYIYEYEQAEIEPGVYGIKTKVVNDFFTEENKDNLVVPNPSFDLCRFASSMLERYFVGDEESEMYWETYWKKHVPFAQVIHSWSLDVDNQVIELDQSFELYRFISRRVMDKIPKEQLETELFKNVIVQTNVINDSGKAKKIKKGKKELKVHTRMKNLMTAISI